MKTIFDVIEKFKSVEIYTERAPFIDNHDKYRWAVNDGKKFHESKKSFNSPEECVENMLKAMNNELG